MTSVEYAIHLYFEKGNKSSSNDKGIVSETHIIFTFVKICIIYFWRYLDIEFIKLLTYLFKFLSSFYLLPK